MSVIQEIKQFYEKPSYTMSGAEIIGRTALFFLSGGLGGWAIGGFLSTSNPLYLPLTIPLIICLFMLGKNWMRINREHEKRNEFAKTHNGMNILEYIKFVDDTIHKSLDEMKRLGLVKEEIVDGKSCLFVPPEKRAEMEKFMEGLLKVEDVKS
jgi:hypothetical protein